MTMTDLEPAARRMANLVRGVSDEQLGDPTPCSETTVGDLLDHISGLTLAFTDAARKAHPEGGSRAPSADASVLGPDWRTRIPNDLDILVQAWRDPAAWTGDTRAGGVELPGEVAGLVALNELVVHSWDVSRATGLAYDCDRPSLEGAHGFLTQFSGPGHEAEREGGFGPVVAVPDDASLLDRVIGLSGRNPGWSPNNG